jgi:hypothetical protein
MNKHTPGIWKGRESITDARGRLIAVVHYSAFNSKNGISLDEGYSNAALICAAPEMLTALKHAVNMLGNQCSPEGREKGWKAIEAAIAKAEGTSK